MKKYFINFIIFMIIIFPVSLYAFFDEIYPTILVPVERLIENTNAFLKTRPRSQSGLYILARIHYLAFTNKSESIQVSEDGIPPKLVAEFAFEDSLKESRFKYACELAKNELGIKTLESQDKEIQLKYFALIKKFQKELELKNWEPEAKISQENLLAHVKESQINFVKALEIDPKNGLYLLGQGSLYSQYLDFKKQKELKNEPLELMNITVESASKLFLNAYLCSISKDLKLKAMPRFGLRSCVSYEAGNAYVKILSVSEGLTFEDKKNISEVSEGISKLNVLPDINKKEITPIIFTLETELTFSKLLSPKINVNFDLDGDGKKELWPWVKSTTGFLVWDPQKTGKITSGRQMFGSVTWWIFFQNGYQALDALDDNRDGQLMGDELIGITTWFDKNSNGISEPGEMIDLQTLGIKSIGTKPTGEINGMPMHSSGITLSNGEKIPTYDWIASPTVAKLK
jgi:hypothetical protein